MGDGLFWSILLTSSLSLSLDILFHFSVRKCSVSIKFVVKWECVSDIRFWCIYEIWMSFIQHSPAAFLMITWCPCWLIRVMVATIFQLWGLPIYSCRFHKVVQLSKRTYCVVQPDCYCKIFNHRDLKDIKYWNVYLNCLIWIVLKNFVSYAKLYILFVFIVMLIKCLRCKEKI